MTDAVNLADRGGYFYKVSALATVDYKLFLFVSDMTEPQPLIDPSAGYGAFHGVKAFFDAQLTTEKQLAFMAACDNKPWIGYVILRACEYKFYDDVQFDDCLIAGCFEARKALEHIQKFLPSFGTADGRHRLEAFVTNYEGNHGHQKADRSA